MFVVYFTGELCVEDADEARSGSWDGAGGRLCCHHFGAYEKKKCEIQKKTKNKYMACVVVITETSPSCPEEEP